MQKRDVSIAVVPESCSTAELAVLNWSADGRITASELGLTQIIYSEYNTADLFTILTESLQYGEILISRNIDSLNYPII